MEVSSLRFYTKSLEINCRQKLEHYVDYKNNLIYVEI